MSPFSTAPRPALVSTEPHAQQKKRALCVEIKREVHEADHSLPSSTEVNNVRAISSLRHVSSWHGA
jgi:hypothetical protein